MRRAALLTLATVAAGIACGAAAAKEVKSAKICGSSGCAALPAREPFFAGNGPAPKETFDVPTGDYYVIRLVMGDRGRTVGTYLMYWLRGRGLVRGTESSSFDPWTRAADKQNAAWKQAVRGLEPFHPSLAKVTVGGRVVADPQSYIRLFRHYPPAYEAPPAGSHWIPVSVSPSHRNPWIERPVSLRYQPERRVLESSEWTVIVPKAIGDRLVASESLASHSGGGGAPAALYAGVGAVAMAAVAAAALWRRRRRHH